VLLRAGGGPWHAVTGKLDSGATSTVVPRPIALDLRVTQQDLTTLPDATTAGGRPLSIWQCSMPISLQVGANQAGPDFDGFGPEVALSGLVGENSNLLLGQRDFFAAFAVTFRADEPEPYFVLEV
jgi:hypothetical protein